LGGCFNTFKESDDAYRHRSFAVLAGVSFPEGLAEAPPIVPHGSRAGSTTPANVSQEAYPNLLSLRNLRNLRISLSA
jgi:hypothetical protein